MRLDSRNSLGFPFPLSSYVIIFSFLSFCSDSLNVLLTSFMLISLFGLLYVVNSGFASVGFSLSVFKYCLMYLVASCPMNVGGLNFPF